MDIINDKNFDAKAEKNIAAEVRMISGCGDSQTSADVKSMAAFELPNPCGRAGGACTAALLRVLYEDNISWVEVLRKMRDVLKKRGFSQIPQLTSSRIINVNDNFTLINPSESKYLNPTRRAVLIGINYYGQSGQLSGCHNDVRNIKDYLITVHDFQENNITTLMDDRYHTSPTYANIMTAFRQAVRLTQSGDTLFCHFSGHGGQVLDRNGDEDDGKDETLIPVDFTSAGQITDDKLLLELVKPLPRDSVMTCLMDCCHSGTVLDLPYRFTADSDEVKGMQRNEMYFSDINSICGCFLCLGFLLDLIPYIFPD